MGRNIKMVENKNNMLEEADLEGDLANLEDQEDELQNLTAKLEEVKAENGSVTAPAKDEEDLEPGEIAVGDEPEAADDPDERSVFVKNVDFAVTEEML